MLMIAGPSAPTTFPTKVLLETRSDPVWKIAPPEYSAKVGGCEDASNALHGTDVMASVIATGWHRPNSILRTQ